jgi:alkylation response protein AidB-like acyl-CoA dehydrogenase
MSSVAGSVGSHAELDGLGNALERIAAGAAQRDAPAGEGRFPDVAFMILRDAGALRWNAVPGQRRPAALPELGLVRRVARADGSVGRIFDGHLNAVERIATQAPAAIRDRELRAVIAGRLWAGVWGGDPVPGEGPAATVLAAGGGDVLRGVKTFCSGAGGLHRALVLARTAAGDGRPVLVWIDLTDDRRIEIDTSWYRSRGLVASVSHRVVFHDAPVLARIGEPGAISTQPWFARDALRTASSWAGMADTAVESAVTVLAQRPERGELEGLAAGRMLTAQRTIDVWLQAAATAMDRLDPDLATMALHGRAAIADACRLLLDEAARACGSRPFARAEALDRARRDLEVFLLQHRLDPMLARAGTAAVEAARS